MKEMNEAYQTVVQTSNTFNIGFNTVLRKPPIIQVKKGDDTTPGNMDSRIGERMRLQDHFSKISKEKERLTPDSQRGLNASFGETFIGNIRHYRKRSDAGNAKRNDYTTIKEIGGTF